MNAAVLMVILACIISVPLAHAQDLPPPEKVEKEHRNMDSSLSGLYKGLTAGGQAQGTNEQERAGGQTVQVVIEMASAGAPVPQGLGIVIESTYEELVQATVPVRNLAAIAADENVAFVRVPAMAVSDAMPYETGGRAGPLDLNLVYVLVVPPVAATAAVILWRKHVT